MMDSIDCRRRVAELLQQAEHAGDQAVRADLVYLAKRFQDVASQLVQNERQESAAGPRSRRHPPA